VPPNYCRCVCLWSGRAQLWVLPLKRMLGFCPCQFWRCQYCAPQTKFQSWFHQIISWSPGLVSKSISKQSQVGAKPVSTTGNCHRYNSPSSDARSWRNGTFTFTALFLPHYKSNLFAESQCLCSAVLIFQLCHCSVQNQKQLASLAASLNPGVGWFYHSVISRWATARRVATNPAVS